MKTKIKKGSPWRPTTGPAVGIQRATKFAVKLFYFFLFTSALSASALLLFLVLSPKPILLDGVFYSEKILDRHGQLLRLTTTPDQKYRARARLKDIAPELVEATLLYEDRFYRSHSGVNPFAILRASCNSLLPQSRLYGGSTITMQVARMRYGLNTRTLNGKINQILKALQLEWHYSKDEILEAYFNLAPYGGNVEGVEAASLVYFGKQSKRLSLLEALTLSVIPQNPIKRTRQPIDANTELNSARSRLFAAWIKEHPQDTKWENFMTAKLKIGSPKNLPFKTPHLTTHLIARTSSYLMEEVSESEFSCEEEVPPCSSHSSLHLCDFARDQNSSSSIVTTIDLALQNQVEETVRDYLQEKASLGIRNTSVLIADARSMEVLVSIGSANFSNVDIKGQVNGTLMRRSPGSTLKPFVYALAMEQGLILPSTILKDTPMNFAEYDPENFDSEFAGPISARNSLIQSRNVPAVQLCSQLHRPNFYEFLKKSQITLRKESTYGLPIVLGGCEVSMEDLVTLYCMLANSGVQRELRYTLDDPLEKGVRRLTPESCYLIREILSECPPPPRVFNPNTPKISWKTGTSFGYRDAWTLGIAGDYVIGVWIGEFSGASNPAFIGKKAAAPLLFQIANSLPHKVHPPASTEHLNLKKIKVCSVSGQLLGPSCHSITQEWFIPGVSPIRTCEVHRQALDGTKLVAQEFWSSDISRRSQKRPDTKTTPTSISNEKAREPKILSPRQNATYFVNEEKSEEQITFQSVVDGEVKKTYWFLDKMFLGSCDAGEKLFWRPKPGEYQVCVVDDQGRSASRSIKVSVLH
jgi:penicillin-binding protein 1C